ncbi:MAG: MBOAT family protein [Clostridia bacterium]|nr:MBOAT family protein [Clostridia bacterium]
MKITSFAFPGFVLAALIVFRLFPAGKRWWVLLAASAVFYLTHSVGGFFVMLLTALLIWFAALRVQKKKDGFSLWLRENGETADRETKKEKKEFYRKKQKRIVAAATAITLGILFLCKYYGVYASGINELFNIKIWTAEGLLLPLGISYFSFQLIGYLVDVHRGVTDAERNPLKVILFGGFFLSVMQGPFCRWDALTPQLCAENDRKLTFDEYRSAVLKIVGGYIKKLCVADQFAPIADEVFMNYTQHKGLGIVLGVVCFAVRLYADFSGYMDIIIGVGQLFGVEMPENFRQPFFSNNMAEFWQRWHITLGAWLRDYVFYPILKSNAFKKMGKALSAKAGANAARKIPTYLGLLILWTLIGLWHGPQLHYVFGVGILQFVYIFLGEITRPVFTKIDRLLHLDGRKLPLRIIRSLRCTLLMMFAWIFFNASSVSAALEMLKNMFAQPKPGQVTSVFLAAGVDGQMRTLIWFAVCIALTVAVDILHEKGISLREFLSRKPYPVRLAVYLLLAFALIIFGAYGGRFSTGDFIYTGF